MVRRRRATPGCGYALRTDLPHGGEHGYRRAVGKRLGRDDTGADGLASPMRTFKCRMPSR